MESNSPLLLRAPSHHTHRHSDQMESFPSFDVLSSGKESDHFFSTHQCGISTAAPSDAAAAAASGATSPAFKKIIKEWKILEKDLPKDSIFVRVYESRIDLMRVAIVGAAGTPYHDGLFFFDIRFPPEYPSVPPQVHFKSFGADINPNLYYNGTVCLSLLNTWIGRKEELWNSNESTVLQVLLSVQALILNEKPYFNEPIRTKMAAKGKWERRSADYNEHVFIVACKMMTWQLKNPPAGFEVFTAAHFRGRADTILSACQAYVSGEAKVGYYGIAATGRRKNRAASKRFKEAMMEVYPSLRSAFLGAGAAVDDFVEQIEYNSEEEKARGIARRIFGKLWKMLSLKKEKRTKKEKEHNNGGGSQRKGDVSGSSQVIPNPNQPIAAAV